MKELQGIPLILVQEWKHFTVLHTTTRGHPLHIAKTKSPRRAQRIGMIHDPIGNYGHGFKPVMRMSGKTRNISSMIHPPPLRVRRKILSERPTLQRSCRTKMFVAKRVIVLMMYTKKKRILCFPGKAQRLNGLNRVFHMYCV